MKITFSINRQHKEPQIVICSDHLSEEIKQVANAIDRAVNVTLQCYKEDSVEMVPQGTIVRIFSENKHVYAQTSTTTYLLHQRLYQLEEELDPKLFIRISNSEIVNLHRIKRIDTSLSGTIRLYLDYDISTYVSRRFVKEIKKKLNI